MRGRLAKLRDCLWRPAEIVKDMGHRQRTSEISMDASATKSRIRRLLRLGVSDGTDPSDAGMGELEMELSLLREENARLKIEHHRAPDTGRVIERMRQLGEEREDEIASEDQSPASETAQAIVECLAIRDALLEACSDIQQAMQGIRGRLGALSSDALEPSSNQKVAAQIEPAQAELDLELALGATATEPGDLSDLSDLSQSAA